MSWGELAPMCDTGEKRREQLDSSWPRGGGKQGRPHPLSALSKAGCIQMPEPAITPWGVGVRSQIAS